MQPQVLLKLNKIRLLSGGMGIYVSSDHLADSVAVYGEGTTGGTFSVTVIAVVAHWMLRVQNNNFVDALEQFRKIVPEAAELLHQKVVVENKPVPQWAEVRNHYLTWLTIFGAFAITWLAGRYHSFPVGANMLEKVQYPHLDCLFGIMLAMTLRPQGAVTYVAVGAGMPTQFPGVINDLVNNRKATYRLAAARQRFEKTPDGPKWHTREKATWDVTLDIAELVRVFSNETQHRVLTMPLQGPLVIGIVAAFSIARRLQRTTRDGFAGFVVELDIAGGHVYPHSKSLGLEEMASLGVPYWIAGGKGSPEELETSFRLRANGIQCGSLFALCEESGMDPDIKSRAIRAIQDGSLTVRLDPNGSPTGFPWHSAELPGTTGVPEVAQGWGRSCDVGHLREAVWRVTGPEVKRQEKLVFRCSAEPLKAYFGKGGDDTEATKRLCLCRQLLGTAGVPNPATGEIDVATLTFGREGPQQVQKLWDWSKPRGLPYTAKTVCDFIFS